MKPRTKRMLVRGTIFVACYVVIHFLLAYFTGVFDDGFDVPMWKTARTFYFVGAIVGTFASLVWEKDA